MDTLIINCYIVGTNTGSIPNRSLTIIPYLIEKHFASNSEVTVVYNFQTNFSRAKIDFPDNDKLNSIEINSNVINSMNYNLAKLICKNWLRGVL